MSFSVYFGSKEVGSKLVLAVSVFEGIESFPEIVEERTKINGTFYENEAMAFKMALENILTEGYEEVTLYNQNKLLFDWLGKKTHENKVRDAIYKEIKGLFQAIVDEGTKIGYQKVKGKENEAKVFLDSYAKGMDDEIDLTVLFKRNKVVPFQRKQAK